MNQSIKSNLTQDIDLSTVSENCAIEKLQKNIASLYGVRKPEEIKQLTAFFIAQLADSLELLPKPTQIEISDYNNLFPVSCFPNLPLDFPERTEMPLYLYGDKVCDQSLEDYGIVIGRFYAFDRQQFQWGWKYLILANQDWAIAPFNLAYLCWEKDLQPLD
ncbi:MAG: hypothetical protein QNJ34_14500 [Xenococcaceae cyanobacterium MO_188.B29]|nr:hypothetical protein [Xenococcaceae cyanobacterium MO_188.B29]